MLQTFYDICKMKNKATEARLLQKQSFCTPYMSTWTWDMYSGK